MTQRERFLAIGVVALIGLVGVNWLFQKYRTAVSSRRSEILSLQDKIADLNTIEVEGEYARQQMAEYLNRSLPPAPEQAKSVYREWMLKVARKNRLRSVDLNSTNSSPIDNLYEQLTYRFTAQVEYPDMVDFLHDFYAKDYLHRIRSLNITPVRATRNQRSSGYKLVMTIDAVALKAADPDADTPGTESWRVDADLASYREPILNRNFFKPPNQAPRYTGQATLTAVAGRRTPVTLTFKDNEDNKISYALIGEVPDSIKLDESNGTLYVDNEEEAEFKVNIKATDNGYPSKSTEQTLLVKVENPPPPEEEPPPPPKFDDANVTRLTALVQGDGEWTAWLHVPIRDKTLKVRTGDEFEIGTIKGKILDVDNRSIEIESEKGKFTVRSGEFLGAAAKRAADE